MRPFPRLKLIGAVLAAAALPLGFAAAAQAGEPVLVSNIDQIDGPNEIDNFGANNYLLIHESPLTDALFLLVSKSDEVTTT